MTLTTVTKSSCLDVVGIADLPLSLLGEVFQRYLSVRHIAWLVTHGKMKDIIFNKEFRAVTISCQVLIFVDKF